MTDLGSPSKKRARKTQLGGNVVVYPGQEGSLAHTAATKFFNCDSSMALHGVDTFGDAFQEVVNGRAVYGVIPIENSSSGPIHCSYDLAVEHDIQFGGEIGMREVYSLCVKGPAKGLFGIRLLLSHQNILEACSTFIKKRLIATALDENAHVETRATRSTTEAAQRVSEASADFPAKTSAAIATKETALRFGLTVLAEDIGNHAHQETRYVLIYKKKNPACVLPLPFPRDSVNPITKRTGCFALRNEPASMYKLLSCWALRGIDVLKVETRPVSTLEGTGGIPIDTPRLWDYYFFVDYVVPSGQTPEAEARLQAALSEFSLWHKDFGSYPAQVTTIEKQSQSWDDMVDLMTKA